MISPLAHHVTNNNYHIKSQHHNITTSQNHNISGTETRHQAPISTRPSKGTTHLLSSPIHFYITCLLIISMGRKSRRNKSNRHEEDDVGSSGSNREDTNYDNSSRKETPKLKDLDFAQRRQLQRQQAAEKRKSKMKCYLCGKSGHVRRDCPGIADDGRGMSRYKGKSDPKKEKQNYRAQKYGEGVTEESAYDRVKLPSDFFVESNIFQPQEHDDKEPLVYYDAGCDIDATLDYLRSGRGKYKISKKEALIEYQSALEYAATKFGLRGLISKTYLRKPGRPLIPPSASFHFTQDFSVPIYYILGLACDVKCDTDDIKHQTTQSLIDAFQCSSSSIIGFSSSLNYTKKGLAQKGCCREEQLERLRCCFEAAGQAKVTLQISTSPGAADLDPKQQNVAGTDYARVLLDLQTIMFEYLSKYPDLRVHLSCWSGRADHMIKLLGAFPTAVVGMDSSVTFSKAAHLHECAFEVPPDSVVIETSTTIPSAVANGLGREAAFHSGWWIHGAIAIAKYKKIPVEDVVRAATETTLRMYPQIVSDARTKV